MFTMRYWFGIGTLVLIFAVQLIKCKITISTHKLYLKINETQSFNISVTNLNKTNVEIRFHNQYKDLIKTDPVTVILDLENKTYGINVTAVGVGKSMLTAQATQDINVDDVFITATIYRYKIIDLISVITGWIYFTAWTISFYPQIYTNFERKSVIGLDFDYLALNIVGYISYTTFTLGLYFIPEIKEEYFERYPRGLIPVRINDIVFNLHGTVAIIVSITQCLIYERGNQRISITAIIILLGIAIFYFVGLLLVNFVYIHWLDFLYFCSYVKLLITLLKYIPQAYLNYKRKSTVGWSIGSVFFDLIGGIFSITQMMLDSYNYDDWISVFGNPSKFGLGFFSASFQIVFLVQHYILYKEKSKDLY